MRYASRVLLALFLTSCGPPTEPATPFTQQPGPTVRLAYSGPAAITMDPLEMDGRIYVGATWDPPQSWLSLTVPGFQFEGEFAFADPNDPTPGAYAGNDAKMASFTAHVISETPHVPSYSVHNAPDPTAIELTFREVTTTSVHGTLRVNMVEDGTGTPRPPLFVTF